MRVRTFGNQVFIDDVEFCKTQIEFAKRFNSEPFEDFKEHFDLLWGFDLERDEDITDLRLLYQYVIEGTLND